MSDPLELIKKAEKKAKPSSGFMKLFTDDADKYEEAADLYVEAANIYRVNKQLGESGNNFIKAAECQLNAHNESEAGNTYVEAYKMYKSIDPASAATAIEKAIDLFTNKIGQFRRAANFEFELGELYESTLHDYKKAITCYQTAGEWYSQDSATALSNKSFLKAADLKALDNEFLEAVDCYSKVVANSIGNRLSQWSLKDYYLKIGLCQLAANDSVTASKTLRDFQINCGDNTSREYNLLKTLIDCYNEQDVNKFSSSVFEFDKFSKLDDWKTKILLKIKDSISKQEDDDLL
ncbi:alpha-soluble NSF attachment protein SEC17 SCDLUD_000073 [Saccharomycodes ludwigii]|uniref:alpha-soluble NSF attachment protein SEC17 n=1 Tax=Saccharomycodes ludwigii TaxID=36035 RepID=UPI001E85DC8F|nr:hypothetical protein SCDLUD_000073 [Saccharomycodes ludwigii]KAH3902496.1 hypothetical protein SCDLUD_000073 [Saccharomycodes ludwigii]